MKISRLTTSTDSKDTNVNSLSFSPRVQLFYSSVDADTSFVRDAIRWVYYFGQSPGQLKWAELELDSENGQSKVRRDGSLVNSNNYLDSGEFRSNTSKVSETVYRNFLDLNFGAGNVSGNQICHLLQQQFNAPLGDCLSESHEGDFFDNDRFELLNQRLFNLKSERQNKQLEVRQLSERLARLEEEYEPLTEFSTTQREVLDRRIERIREELDAMREKSFALEKEIEKQSTLSSIDQTSAAIQGVQSTALEHKLQDLEQQTLRWRAVQEDIDARSNDLKTGLNSNRLDEFDGAFDELRSVLRSAEEKTNELESVTTDSQTTAQLRQIQNWHHTICELLSEVQWHWRQKLVTSELRDLDRCRSELDQHVQRLHAKRVQLTSPETKKRIGSSYCGCNFHPNTNQSSGSVLALKRELDELLGSIAATQNLLQKTIAEREALYAGPNLELVNQIKTGRRTLQAKQAELESLSRELESIEHDIEVEKAKPKRQHNRLLLLVANYFSEITGGRFSRLFLSTHSHDLVLVSTDGSAIPFNSVSNAVRVQARTAISLGIAKLLHESGYRIPLIIEDPFIGFTEQEISTASHCFSKFSTEIQLVLLSNDRFVRSWFAERGIPTLDLPDHYSGDLLPPLPREDRPGDGYFNNKDINRNLDLAAMDQHGTELEWYKDELGHLSVSGQKNHRGTSLDAYQSTKVNVRHISSTKEGLSGTAEQDNFLESSSKNSAVLYLQDEHDLEEEHDDLISESNSHVASSDVHRSAINRSSRSLGSSRSTSNRSASNRELHVGTGERQVPDRVEVSSDRIAGLAIRLSQAPILDEVA